MEKIILIEEQALEKFYQKMETLVREVNSTKQNDKFGWLNNEQFCDALQISKRTAQNYRDQGLIPFSLVGGKVYYMVVDLQHLLKKHLQKR